MPNPSALRDLAIAVVAGVCIGGAGVWYMATAVYPGVQDHPVHTKSAGVKNVVVDSTKTESKAVVASKARVERKASHKRVVTTETFDPKTGVLVNRVKTVDNAEKSTTSDQEHTKTDEVSTEKAKTLTTEITLESKTNDVRQGVAAGLMVSGEGIGPMVGMTLVRIGPASAKAAAGVIASNRSGLSPRIGLGIDVEPTPRLGIGIYGCLAPASDPLGYSVLPGLVDVAPAVAIHYEF